MKIVIKPLAPALTLDYLDFFDNRAFSDGNPNGPCYCNAPIMDAASIQQMESEFGNDCKGVLRRYAVNQLADEMIHGYMAFYGNVSIGWCNAGNMDSYPSNDFHFIPDDARKSACGTTMSVVCFAIAPEYRGKGVAAALLEYVIADAKAKDYRAVEGYARVRRERSCYDFNGPVQLYEKAGFYEVKRVHGIVIQRKILK